MAKKNNSNNQGSQGNQSNPSKKSYSNTKGARTSSRPTKKDNNNK